MSLEDYIDEEDIEFVNELENPKKYHYEEHSDDTIHFYEDGEEILYDEVVDLLNEQEEQLTTINEFVFTLLNKLDIQDAFIRDYFEIIKKCDLKRMNNIIQELRDVE